ncbi:MAG: acyl carrier protein [Planctomycetes bacterium]|nr:acyl carrier protein [Planctomycetota bacterium]MBU4398660.1 acyl carrier protein [Planctomycetota bacterium]MCG2683884.1 acyl carrier protein [Planctomycetales bacterium]
MPVIERLAAIFDKVFGVEADEFSPDLTPEDVLRWDSLGHMTLIMDLEDEFGVHFEVDEITEMTSAGRIIEILQAKGVTD